MLGCPRKFARTSISSVRISRAISRAINRFEGKFLYPWSSICFGNDQSMLTWFNREKQSWNHEKQLWWKIRSVMTVTVLVISWLELHSVSVQVLLRHVVWFKLIRLVIEKNNGPIMRRSEKRKDPACLSFRPHSSPLGVFPLRPRFTHSFYFLSSFVLRLFSFFCPLLILLCCFYETTTSAVGLLRSIPNAMKILFSPEPATRFPKSISTLIHKFQG